MSYRFRSTGHTRWIRLICHFSLTYFTWLFSSLYWDIWHGILVDFSIPSIGFNIVIYSIFWEIIQVLRRGVIIFGKRNVFKSFVFAHSHFMFCALQVLGRSTCWWLTRRRRRFWESVINVGPSLWYCITSICPAGLHLGYLRSELCVITLKSRYLHLYIV